jgi:hypothetical protein
MATGKKGEINTFLPAQVTRISKGVGSFVNLYFEIDPNIEGHIWIYLCDWVLMDGQSEIENSTTIRDDSKLRTFFTGERLLRVDTLGPKAALILTGEKRLEIQANRQEYGDDDMLITYIPGHPPAGYGPAAGTTNEYGWNVDA